MIFFIKMGSFRIDIEKIVKEKVQGRRVPRCVVRWLQRIAHEEDLNKFLAQLPENVSAEAFLDAGIEELLVSMELPDLPELKSPVIFVCNHPLGGLDGMIIVRELLRRYKDRPVRVFVNDLLLNIKPLSPLFLPISKTGRQSRELSEITHKAYQADQHILTFPAGACSRQIDGKIQDITWRKNFVQMAIKYKRDIIPMHFEGQNSKRFYRLARIRKWLGIKVNIEMLTLVDEMYRQRGKHYKLTVRETIKWEELCNGQSAQEWAEKIQKGLRIED